MTARTPTAQYVVRFSVPVDVSVTIDARDDIDAEERAAATARAVMAEITTPTARPDVVGDSSTDLPEAYEVVEAGAA